MFIGQGGSESETNPGGNEEDVSTDPLLDDPGLSDEDKEALKLEARKYALPFYSIHLKYWKIDE